MAVTHIEALLAGLTDSAGASLSAGKVYTYTSGTTTLKETWSDSAQTTVSANPIILDANGRALVFAEGSYKFVIKDSSNNTLYTWDNLGYEGNSDSTIYAGNSSGSSNAYVLTPDPVATGYIAGDTYRFIANFSNTGATTVNVSSLGAKNIKTWDGNALASGDIPQNSFATISYNGTDFRLLSNDAANATAIAELESDLAALEASAQSGALSYGGTSGGAANAQTISLTPALTAYAAGNTFKFLAGFTNTTTAPTINIDGLGAKTIKRNDGSTCQIGDIVVGAEVELVYNGTDFLFNSPSGLPTKPNIQDGSLISGGTSGGSANAQTISLTPAITAYTSGMIITFHAGFTNTGAATLAVNGLTAQDVYNVKTDGALKDKEITSGRRYTVIHDGTRFQLQNPSEDWLNYSPTASGSGSMTISSLVINYAKYKRVGNLIYWIVSISFTTGGTASLSVFVSSPTTMDSASYETGSGTFVDTGNAMGAFAYAANTTTFTCRKYDASNWGLGSGRLLNLSGFYKEA